MSQRWVLVKNGIVENIIIADEAFINTISAQYEHTETFIDESQEPKIGWTYSGGVYAEPVSPTPTQPEPQPEPQGGGQ